MVIKVIIDKRRANAEGKYPVKLKFSTTGRGLMYSLNAYAYEHEFDEKTGLLYSSNKNRQMELKSLNSVITAELERAKAIDRDYTIKGKEITIDRLKSELSKNPNEDKQEITFNDYFRTFIASQRTPATRICYEGTLRKIEEYCGKKIYFEDITYSWLNDFDKKLHKRKIHNKEGDVVRVGIKTNTRAIQFRNIRAVFNSAINNDIVGIEMYPFRKFKIKHEKTRKRAIAVEELRALFNFRGTEEENWAVDVAKVIFFLMGINIKDLHSLQQEERNRIVYSRAKTGTPYSIKIEPELKEIIERYPGKTTIFSFKERFKLHSSFTKRVNKRLEDICKSAGIPKITTYTLRHTWATLAAELDIPKETISAGLGHSSTSVTDIYILFDYKKIDAANRRVIDYVFKVV